MSTSKRLADRLSSLERRRASLRVWRAAREPYDVLSTRGARLWGGRWHPAGVPTLYVSFEPMTVRAELARAAELQGDPEETIYPLRLVQIGVDADLVDLTDSELLSDLEVVTPISALVPKKQTQRVGLAALRLGIGALIVSSVAARAENAVIFTDNLSGPIEVLEERPVASPSGWG